MIQEFLYRVFPPEGRTVDDLVEALVPPARNMMDNNRFVAGVRIDIEVNFLEFWLTLKGHDRWWNIRRVPYLIMPILTGAGLDQTNVEFQRIENVPNLKSARFWSSGKHNEGSRIFMPADGSEPSPRSRKCKGCKAEQQPAQFHSERSGWHQSYGKVTTP